MDALVADVVVLGSGGAGLVAASVAADAGLSVVLCEAADRLGGATAVSGGMLWIANNGLSSQIGIEDDRDDALRYWRHVTRGETEPAMLEALVDSGAELVRYLVDETPVRLFPIDRPDYNAQWPGGRPGGRVLDNEPFDTSAWPGLDRLVRQGAHFPPLTYAERHERRWQPLDEDLVAQRVRDGVVTLGRALVAGLVAAVQQRGVRLLTSTRAVDLLQDGGAVTGVRCTDREGDPVTVSARAVVVATGGFEWDEQMTRAFLRGPTSAVASPPWNVGDGHHLVMRAGGTLAAMSEAWWAPMIVVPGETYEGRPMGRHLVDELSLPGSLLVNRYGARFGSESVNYNDLSKHFHVFDPQAYEYPNVPAWLVFDHRFASRYQVGPVRAASTAPAWFHASSTVDELARRVGIDPAGLGATLDEFNADARAGVDRRYRRGTRALDLYYGDPRHTPNPCLAPLEEPPFYAVEVRPGLLGTKGGARTDTDGRVLRRDGTPIAGLYACSNAAASPVGPGYPGAGGSLGPLLTFGLRCGRAAALDLSTGSSP